MIMLFANCLSRWICRNIKLPTLGVPAVPRLDPRQFYRLVETRSCGTMSRFTFDLLPGKQAVGLQNRINLTCTPGAEWQRLGEKIDRLR
jgi:hypothetical protein